VHYSVSKTIRKPVSPQVVYRAIASRLMPQLTLADDVAAPFWIKGFSTGIGSINYSLKATFDIQTSEDRTTVVASVEHSPTLWFWLFVLMGLFTGFFWIVLPVGFYFYGKNQAMTALERTLREVADQLE
jgi:hypothetical protein